jgi:CubicO group peptidase (beta-lactamase class C family)
VKLKRLHFRPWHPCNTLLVLIWGALLLVAGCADGGGLMGPEPRSGGLATASESSSSEEFIWPTAGWTVATPEEMGMRSEDLYQARDYAMSTGGGSGYITRGGRLVLSWGSPTTKYALKSTTKSIGGTLLGIAIGDGLVSLDAIAQSYYASFGVPPQTNETKGWLDDITLRHLATHTAGFAKGGGYGKLLHAPGAKWTYSDGGANWLADVLTVRFAQDLKALLLSRVFTPLGLPSTELKWRLHSTREQTLEGIVRREFNSGIQLDVDAMARIGYLYLRGGRWEDAQILPESYVSMVGIPDPATVGLPITKPGSYPGASNHYGLLWWNNGDGALAGVPTDAFWAWGLGDSFIIVIPSLDIVVTRAGPGWRSGWNADYAVLAPFLEPIVASVAPTSP